MYIKSRSRGLSRTDPKKKKKVSALVYSVHKVTISRAFRFFTRSQDLEVYIKALCKIFFFTFFFRTDLRTLSVSKHLHHAPGLARRFRV